MLIEKKIVEYFNKFNRRFTHKVFVYQCDECKKLYETRNGRGEFRSSICSKECYCKSSKPGGFLFKKRVATCLEKFGTENPFASEVCKEKMRETWIENYGVDNPFKSEVIKKKIKIVLLKNYGVENPMYSEEICAKQVATMQKNWGVDYCMQLQHVKDALMSGSIEKYGAPYISQSEKGRNILKEIFLKKYGVDNPLKVETIKEKMKQTCFERYGVTNISKSQYFADLPYKSGCHKSGYVKFRDRDIWCRSSYEQIFVKWLEENKDVEDIACNICIDYEYESKKKKYFIDFCVTFKSGKRVLYEVKSKYGTTLLQNIAKFEAGRVYAKEFGYECFLVVTEDDFENLKSF